MKSYRFAATALLLAVSGLVSCDARPRNFSSSEAQKKPILPDEKRVVEVDLTSGAPETLSGGGLFKLPASRSFVGLARILERHAKETTTAGVFVRLGSEQLDWARSEEIAGLLSKIRKQGKPVVCHAHALSNSSSWLAASGCSRIWLSPAGEVATVGIAAQMLYFKGIFDRLKIGVDMLHVGKFKSGAEPLTREGPSEEARVSLTETLGQIRNVWLAQTTQARPQHKLREHLENGPWSAGEAKERGIIDEIGVESAALEDAKKNAKVTAIETVFGPRAGQEDNIGIAEILRVIAGGDESGAGRPHIAVVPAEGSITMESGGAFDSGGITEKALGKTLRKLLEDESVHGVVLRIDSPGGSPLASDLLWHDMMKLRKKKPVVVSIGGMAASGGYYIACAGQRIFAERTSIVGSIGVFGGKIVLSPAFEQFGINTVTFPASPEPGAAERAAFGSPFMPWDESTRARALAQMKSIYDLFVARVADSRKMPAEKVRASAEGRIWSGTQGLERGLVDEIGGLIPAIAHARKLAKLPDDAPIVVEGAKESLLETLLLGEDASEADVKAALIRFQSERKQLFLHGLPKELRHYASALAPLAAGEHVVAALPFALVVK